MSPAIPTAAPAVTTRSGRRLALGATAAAALLAGVLLPAAPASADATTRWVDPAAAASAPGTACGASAGYATIAAAVAAAAAGDTIRVCAGDYSEGKVTVNTANLSFYGAQAGVSAGVGSARSEAPADAESNVDVEFTFNKPFVTIDGFSFSSVGRAVYAMGAADGGTVVNNRFVGTSRGVASYGDLVEVSGNLFADSGWGVHHDDSGTIGGLVRGNVFRNLSYAVSSAAHHLVIEGNVITGIKQRGFTLYGHDNTVIGNTLDMPSTSAGEAAITITSSATTTTITGNTLTGPRPSLWVGANATAITVERNNLLGTGLGAVRTSGAPFAIGANWWGSNTGPFVDGALDPARVTNVTVASWCADATCTAALTEPLRSPAAPPAADSDALDRLGLPDSSNQFSNAAGGTGIGELSGTEPLSGSLPWTAGDSWVDVWAYSTPVFLGSLPVVNGEVQLSGLDLSALEAGGHRLVFVGQTSGARSVAVFSIAAGSGGAALAASGADAATLGLTAGVLLAAGAVFLVGARRRRVLA